MLGKACQSVPQRRCLLELETVTLCTGAFRPDWRLQTRGARQRPHHRHRVRRRRPRQPSPAPSGTLISADLHFVASMSGQPLKISGWPKKRTTPRVGGRRAREPIPGAVTCCLCKPQAASCQGKGANGCAATATGARAHECGDLGSVPRDRCPVHMGPRSSPDLRVSPGWPMSFQALVRRRGLQAVVGGSGVS